MPSLLSSQSPVPLYFQLAQHLRERLKSGEFSGNAPLPTEDQLCAAYEVSRTTVRQAMADLLAQRLIVRRRGLGTFVAQPSQGGKHSLIVGSIHEALHFVQGTTYEHRSAKEIVPPPDIAEQLGLAPGEKAHARNTLGSVDGQPLVYATGYFPLRFGKLLREEDFTATTSFLHLLEKRVGATATRATQTVEPDKADAVVAEALGLPKASAILKITRVFYLADGTALEASLARYHPQRYKLQLELVERPPQ